VSEARNIDEKAGRRRLTQVQLAVARGAHPRSRVELVY